LSGGLASMPGPAPLRDQSVGGFDLSIGNVLASRRSVSHRGQQTANP
jgi:hypothetical protein